MCMLDWGCVGLEKTGESVNISSGLQRTAEELECFQMALQQKQALAGRQAHPKQPQSVPASSLQRPVHTVRMYKEYIHLWMRSTHKHLYVTECRGMLLVYADTENTKTVWPLIRLIYSWVAQISNVPMFDKKHYYDKWSLHSKIIFWLSIDWQTQRQTAKMIKAIAWISEIQRFLFEVFIALW